MAEKRTTFARSLLKALDALQSSIREQANAIREQRKGASHGQEPNTLPTVGPVVSLPPAVTAYYQAEQSDRPFREKRERVVRIVGFVGVVAAVILAVLTFVTLRQIKRQADSAGLQVTIMQHQLVVEDRAWLKVRFKDEGQRKPDTSEIKQLLLNANVSNVGKTPARKVFVEAIVELVKATEPPSFSYAAKSHITTKMAFLFPGEDHDISFASLAADDSTSPLKVTSIEQEKLASGDIYLASFGQATYVDEFGPHWTHFCWWVGFKVGARYNAATCVDYNDVDSNNSEEKVH